MAVDRNCLERFFAFPVLRGCIVGEREVSEMALEIQSKQWTLRTFSCQAGNMPRQ
jgi:hypothetical protein